MTFHILHKTEDGSVAPISFASHDEYACWKRDLSAISGLTANLDHYEGGDADRYYDSLTRIHEVQGFVRYWGSAKIPPDLRAMLNRAEQVYGLRLTQWE